jgi:hypothetical protein
MYWATGTAPLGLASEAGVEAGAEAPALSAAGVAGAEVEAEVEVPVVFPQAGSPVMERGWKRRTCRVGGLGEMHLRWGQMWMPTLTLVRSGKARG